MYSPVPNAYFAKYVNKETQQDSSQNTASQPSTCTSVQQEVHPSTDCTDEELVSALSQAEELAETTVNTCHDDAERISEDSKTASNLSSDAHHETESRVVSPPGEEETNLGSSVSGEERATLLDGEMNVELSRQVASDERAKESNETSPSAEASNGTSHNSGQDSSSGSNDHGDTTWISCMVGRMIDLYVYIAVLSSFRVFLYSLIYLTIIPQARVGYEMVDNHLILNKGEWNNCFIKKSPKNRAS